MFSFNRHSRIFLAIPAFCLCISLQGQQFQFNIRTIDDELSKGLIKDIITDEVGFIWAATDEGVIKFDGRQSFFFEDEINGRFAKAFCKRSNGQLLVLHDFGLTEIISKPDTTYFKSILSTSSETIENRLNYPKTIYEDQSGALWIGENQDVIRYQDGQFKRFNLGVNSGQGLLFRSFSFAEDGFSNLWVFSFSGQAFIFNPQDQTLEPRSIPCPVNDIYSATKVKTDQYWLNTKEGIIQIIFNPKQQIASCEPITTIPNISSSIIYGEDAYVGTWKSGLYFTNLKASPYDFKRISNFPHLDVVGMNIDANNGLWISSSENFSLLSPISFETFDLGIKPKTLNAQDATIIESIYLDPKNQLVALSGRELFTIHGGQVEEKLALSFLPKGVVPLSCMMDGASIFIGSINGRVFQYHKDKKESKPLEGIPLSNSSIQQIFKDHSNNIWISGNQTSGLVRIDEQGNILNQYKEKGISRCNLIYESDNHVLFAGGQSSESYLFLYAPLKEKFIDISEPLPFEASPNFEVVDLLVFKDQLLFLATSDGLLSYNLQPNNGEKKRIKRVDLKKIPLSEPIKGLDQSDDGTLWVATNRGLIAYKDDQPLLFDKSNGLPSNNMVTRGLKIDKNGKIWVATAKGIALFKPNGTNLQKTPKPIINAIKVNGVKHLNDYISQNDLAYLSNLDIHFQSLSIPADKIRYQYRILEKDSTWSNSFPDNNVVLSSLTAGQYTFEVKAQQEGDFQWSEATQLLFTIALPWYLKWWTQGLIVLLLLGLLISVARAYNYNLLKKNERLEAIIMNRMEEIKRQKNEIIDQQKEIIQQNEKYRQLKEKQLREQIEYKNKQLTTYTLNLIQKNEALKELRLKIVKDLRANGTSRETQSELKSYLSLIDYSFRKDKEWEKFKLFFEEVHAEFFESLVKRHPAITPQDLRHCALIKLNLSIQETATILGISPESVKTSRLRLRKKMELEKSADLVDYLMKS